MAALETCFWRATGVLENLSEQQLLDCGTQAFEIFSFVSSLTKNFRGKYSSIGCNGALFNSYFDLIKNNQAGQCADARCYPYRARVEQCQEKCWHSNAKMADFSISYRVNEEDLKKLVYINPVEAGVDVGYLPLIF